MIPLIAPLVLGGLAVAIWREHQQKKRRPSILISSIEPSVPALTLDSKQSGYQTVKKTQVIDDTAEILHYQRVSLASLALSASGAIFYAPMVLASVPLLSYSAFYFIKTIRRSSDRDKKSALIIFEVASLAGTFVIGRYVMTASLFSLAYSTRKWILQAGNLANVGVRRAIDPQFNQVWVLRDEAEIEITLSDIQANDIVILHEGDIIKANGVIVNGEGIIRQYSLAGMMQVVPKKSGDPVFSFTKIVAGDFHVKYIR